MPALLIVRHGNTFAIGEVPRRIGARSDPELTEMGRSQMCTLGAALRAFGLTPTRILSSDLRRAKDSAQCLAEAFSAPPPISHHHFLREIDHGPDEGATEMEVLDRLGRGALAGWARRGEAPAGWTVDGAQRQRSWRQLIENVRRDQSGDQICVTSNGAARFSLLCHPELRVAGRNWGDLSLRTGSCGMIVAEPSVTRLIFWNVRPGEAPLTNGKP